MVKKTKAPLMLMGINESFDKREKELISEMVWDKVREMLPESPGITGISYEINVQVQEEE